MTPAKSVAELLVEWEEQTEAGKKVALEELCRDAPDLLETVRAGVEQLRAVQSNMATRRIEPSREGMARGTPAPGDSAVDVMLPSIPGYSVVRKLGQGGMGIVYLARQEGLERLVAIKMLHQGSEAERTLSRFRTEAEVIARLQHPNLIQIYEVGSVAGRPFFSMEYVADGTLEERLGGRPQPPREAARLVQILASAMHEAHRCGVVHRDLKPGNILLRREAGAEERSPVESGVWVSSADDARVAFCPKITDFGLAKRLDVSQGMTVTHSVMGTPCYMAPEQARGDSKHVAETTDIYSLGAIFYELLTGRPPFKGGSVFMTLHLVSNVDPAPPRTLQPGVPHDLEVICLKCLQKKPAKRYSKVIDLALDLSRFLAGEPIQARPTGRFERAVKWARRRPSMASAIAVGVIAVCTLLAVSAYFNVALERAFLAEQARALESRHRLVRLEVAQGNTALDRNDSTLAMLWFADALRLDDPAREKAHRLRLGMAGMSSPHLRQIWFHGESVRQASFDVDGKRAFTVGEDGSAQLWDLTTLEAAGKPLMHPGPVVDGALGAGDLLVTAGADGYGRVWDTARGTVTAVLKHDGPLTRARFDPAGRKIVTASNDGTAKLWSSDGRLIATLKHEGPVIYAAFGPNGRLVVTAALDHTVRVWETEHGTPVTPPLSHDGRVENAALSPDGTLVATAGHDAIARIWPVRDGASVPQLLKHGLPVTCVAFNRDGSRLATGSHDGTVRIWDPVTGNLLGSPLRHDGGVLGIAFHPDDNRLATCSDDNTARLWDTSTGEQLTAQLKHGGNVQSVAFGPGGRFVLTGSIDGTARLWAVEPVTAALSIEKRKLSKTPPPDRDAKWWSADRKFYAFAVGSHSAQIHSADGRPVGRPLVHGSLVNFAAFTPDGTRLVTTSEDCTARLWNALNGELLVPPLKQMGSVRFAAFSPDSRSYVITASTDGTARVWDALSGEPVTRALKFSGSPSGVAFPSEEQVQVRSVSGDEEWTTIWPLVSNAKPAEVLLARAEILSHCRIDPDRGLMPLDSQTLRTAWRQAGPTRATGK